MTDLMESPTTARVDDGLSDRWEFEGYGVRLDVFPQPIEPGKLRFTFPVNVAARTRLGDRCLLYRDEAPFKDGEAPRDADRGDELTIAWEVEI